MNKVAWKSSRNAASSTKPVYKQTSDAQMSSKDLKFQEPDFEFKDDPHVADRANAAARSTAALYRHLQAEQAWIVKQRSLQILTERNCLRALRSVQDAYLRVAASHSAAIEALAQVPAHARSLWFGQNDPECKVEAGLDADAVMRSVRVQARKLIQQRLGEWKRKCAAQLAEAEESIATKDHIAETMLLAQSRSNAVANALNRKLADRRLEIIKATGRDPLGDGNGGALFQQARRNEILSRYSRVERYIRNRASSIVFQRFKSQIVRERSKVIDELLSDTHQVSRALSSELYSLNAHYKSAITRADQVHQLTSQADRVYSKLQESANILQMQNMPTSLQSIEDAISQSFSSSKSVTGITCRTLAQITGTPSTPEAVCAQFDAIKAARARQGHILEEEGVEALRESHNWLMDINQLCDNVSRLVGRINGMAPEEKQLALLAADMELAVQRANAAPPPVQEMRSRLDQLLNSLETTTVDKPRA